MNIILGEENIRELDDRYIALELDIMRFPGNDNLVRAYCLVESVNLTEMSELENFRSLHTKLMENYYKKNWSFCEQALEHLRGRWSGELDSFYDVIEQRIQKFKEHDPGPDWTGAVLKI